MSQVINIPKTPTVIYRCTSCGYSECSLTHWLGKLIDWIRERKEVCRCPKCGMKMNKEITMPPADPPWIVH